MPQLSALIAWTTIFLALGTGGLFSFWVQDQDKGQPLSVAETLDLKPGDVVSDEIPPKEELVKNWDNPDFVLFLSGRLHGYIEPCGCTGLENQNGGLLRRYEVLKLLRDRGWNILPIDAGDQVNRLGKQSLVKLQVAYEAMCSLMDYQCISFGLPDLKLSAIDLGQAMLNKMIDPDKTPFLCANVTVLDESLSKKLRIIDSGDRKILVTAVVGAGEIAEIRDDDIKTVSPQNALEQLESQIRGSNADLKVLICHASLEESDAIAKQFPIFDMVVTAGGVGDPLFMPELIQSGDHITRMIQVGAKGMHVGLVGFWGDKTGADRIVYERVPLDPRFEDFVKVKDASNLNPMERLFKSYQDELKSLYENSPKLLGVNPRKHSSGHSYVGSAVCNDCHDEEFEIWKDGIDGKGGPHARATKDLTDPGQRTWVARNFDPECLNCHVTGWNVREFFPYETGYVDLKKDEHLHGNGCENCHGPGSKHVGAENGDFPANEAQLKQFRREIRVTMTQVQNGFCTECHDIDNSPDFFKENAVNEYWAKIAHGDGIDNVDADDAPGGAANQEAGQEQRCP